MKSKITLTLMASLLVLPMINANNVQASDSHHDHDMQVESSDHNENAVIDIGNKVCPVSGEAVGEMGEAYKVEHNGKSYNLCCKMCAKDFKKDPDKYIAKLAGMNASEVEHPESSHDGHGDHQH